MQSSSVLLVINREEGLQLSQDDLLLQLLVGFPGNLWPAAVRLPRNRVLDEFCLGFSTRIVAT